MPDDGIPLPWFHPITLVILGILSLVTLSIYCLLPSINTSSSSNSKKSHAVITGGSSGIGFAIAQYCGKVGFQNVTLVARNQERLLKAQTSLKQQYPNTNYYIQSVDIGTNYGAVSAAAFSIVQGNGKQSPGPPSILFNNAGLTAVHAFQDVPVDQFETLIKANYLGVVYITKALLKEMRPGSSIIMTSSVAGQVGVYGYTAYSPSKFALRGFAECLAQEVRRDGITVALAFPPDTDTTMYEAENKTKPKETLLISEATGLMKPQQVAQVMVDAALKPIPPFFIYFGFEGWMLAMLTAGMSPLHGLLDGLVQVFLGGIFRFVSLFYLWDFARIIAKQGQKEKKE